MVDNLTAKQYNPFTYFICGPKGFKDNLLNILSERNVPDGNVITEEFTPSTQLGTDAEQEKKIIPKYTYGASVLTFVLCTLFFMAIDLVRYVPKITNAQTTSVPLNQKDDSSSTVTPTTDDSSSIQPTQQNSNPAPQQTYYQAPTPRAS